MKVYFIDDDNDEGLEWAMSENEVEDNIMTYIKNLEPGDELKIRCEEMTESEYNSLRTGG